MHKYPAVHNAMWPGLVGKGPDSEPPIDLDTMLDMTAAAQVDGAQVRRRRSVPVRPAHQHRFVGRRPEAAGRQDRGEESRRRLARRAVWPRPAAARRWAARGAARVRHAGAEGVRDRQEASRSRHPQVRRRPDRLGRESGDWAKDPEGNRRRSPKHSGRPRTSPRASASGWRPKAKSAGAACTAGSGWRAARDGGPAEDARFPGRHGAHAALHHGLQRPRGSDSSRRTTTGRAERRSTRR